MSSSESPEDELRPAENPPHLRKRKTSKIILDALSGSCQVAPSTAGEMVLLNPLAAEVDPAVAATVVAESDVAVTIASPTANGPTHQSFHSPDIAPSHMDMPRRASKLSSALYKAGQVALWAAAVVVPVSCMITLTIIFQGMSLAISSGLFFVMGVLMFFVLRRAGTSRATWVLFTMYLSVCAFLLLSGTTAIFRVFYESNEGQDLAWFGAPTSSSVHFTVYSYDSERAFIQWGSLSLAGNTCNSTAERALSDNDDKLASFAIEGLEDNTRYGYTVQLVRSDGVVRAGPKGEFKTMPSAGSADKIVFASSSCSSRGQRAVPVPLEAYSRIAVSAPDFMLFLGDLIYADIPLGFGPESHVGGFGQTDQALYKADYRGTLGDAHMRDFMAKTGFLFMLDDHEIVDNYRQGNETQVYEVALGAWEAYAGVNNPRPTGGANRDGGKQYSYELGSHDMFVLDTRTKRDPSIGAVVGGEQLAQLEAWLVRTQSQRAGFKFVASPSPFTTNSLNPAAGWNCACARCEVKTAANAAECPSEREHMLDFVEANGIKNVVLISGDAHKPGVVELRSGIVEFSVSPILAWAQDLDLGVEDKPLFQQNEINMAWAVYTLENGSLTVDIYAGGIGLQSTAALVIFTTALVSYLVSWAVFYKLHNGATVFGEPVPVAGAITLVAGVLVCYFAYLQLPSTIDAGFKDGPVFTWSKILE